MTTQRAPSSRAARVAWASSSGAPVDPILRTASHTRSRPTTVRPSTHLRSAVTVSAMPVPSQSSSGLPVMLVRLMTATTGAAGASPTRDASPPIASRSRPSSRRDW
ncbi:MAG: hypothetical protein DMF77_08430 [Acidobacteria bacterium]|nr:MAG: hypothetical protein DMF77_08430 [Acidobacteriota bacterium]